MFYKIAKTLSVTASITGILMLAGACSVKSQELFYLYALARRIAAHRHADSLGQLALDEPRAERQVDVRAQQKGDHRRAPHDRIDSCEKFNHGCDCTASRGLPRTMRRMSTK